MKCGGILFVSYGGSHVNMLKEVYKVVSDRVDANFLALTSAVPIMEKYGSPYHTIETFEYDQQKIESVLKKFGEDIDIQKNLYLGIGLRELVLSVGFVEAMRLYTKYGRSALCPRGFAKKILDYFKPKILYVSNLIRLPRALVVEANSRGICTIYIEDLFGYSSHPFTAELAREVVYPSVVLHYIIAISNEASSSIKNNLEHNFINGKPTLVALGNPNIENTIRNGLMQKGGGIGDKNYVLFLSNKFFRDDVTDLLAQYCKINSNQKIIIKIHPNENSGFYIEKFKGCKSVVVVSNQYRLSSLIQEAAVILSTNSTALFEAYLLGKEVSCLNPMHSKELIKLYIDTGIAKNISTLDELSACILDRKKYKKSFLRDKSMMNISLDSVQNTSRFLEKLYLEECGG